MIANLFPMVNGDFGSAPASCDKIIKVWTTYKKEYGELQNKFSSSYLDEANNFIDKWSIQIQDATLGNIKNA
ncbi:MAG: hypothetical protein CM1200mP1_10470 [Candidatus Neomarinimicrobiota bacterium]|nr:MAG: hypothetical protein CM1200mP1_10470 [Candidatus Neomarinimicrobiota bacterium]